MQREERPYKLHTGKYVIWLCLSWSCEVNGMGWLSRFLKLQLWWTCTPKCGNIGEALNVLRSDPRKDISTWNSIIFYLGMHGFGENALDIFAKMLVKGLKPNDVAFIRVHTSQTGRKILVCFKLTVKQYEIQPTIEHYGRMVGLLESLDLVKTRPLKKLLFLGILVES
ncbi:hypothetical protein DITRI_Ditri19aG0055200 [Diplodiscus trichospermus]